MTNVFLDRMTEAMASALQGTKAHSILGEVYKLEIAPFVPASVDARLSTYTPVHTSIFDQRVGLALELHGGDTIRVTSEFELSPTDQPSFVVEKLRRAARELAAKVSSEQTRHALALQQKELDNASRAAVQQLGEELAELDKLV